MANGRNGEGPTATPPASGGESPSQEEIMRQQRHILYQLQNAEMQKALYGLRQNERAPFFAEYKAIRGEQEDAFQENDPIKIANVTRKIGDFVAKLRALHPDGDASQGQNVAGATEPLPAVFRKNRRGSHQRDANFSYDENSPNFFTEEKARARLSAMYHGGPVPQDVLRSFNAFHAEIVRAREASDAEAVAAIEIMNRFLSDVEGNVQAHTQQGEAGSETTDEDEASVGNDGTRAEQVGLLRRLIGKFDTLRTNTSERFAKSADYLLRRVEDIDAKAAEKGGGVEGYFRLLGENYNKLHWGWKLGVGASLGVGAILSSGVSLPTALGLASGLAGQRILGMAGIFLKLEKHLQDTAEGRAGDFVARRGRYKKFAEGTAESRKNKAMLTSALISIGAGAAIGATVNALSKTEMAYAVQDWLIRNYPSESASPVSTKAVRPAPTVPAEVPKPPTLATSVADTALKPAVETPKPATPASQFATAETPSVADQEKLEKARAEREEVAKALEQKKQELAAAKEKVAKLRAESDATVTAGEATAGQDVIARPTTRIAESATSKAPAQNANVLGEARELAVKRIAELDAARAVSEGQGHEIAPDAVAQIAGAEGSRPAFFEQPLENSPSPQFEAEAPAPVPPLEAGGVIATEGVTKVDITSTTGPDYKTSLEGRTVTSPTQTIGIDLTGDQKISAPEPLNPQSFEKFNPEDFPQITGTTAEPVPASETDGAGTPPQEIESPVAATQDLRNMASSAGAGEPSGMLTSEKVSTAPVQTEAGTLRTPDSTQPSRARAPFIEPSAPQASEIVPEPPAAKQLVVSAPDAVTESLPDAGTPPQEITPEPSLKTPLESFPDEHDAHELHTYDEPPASSETQPVTSAQASAHENVPNQYGLTVSADKTHLYTDAKNQLFVFGGTPEQRAKLIYEYLVDNPTRIVYDTDVGNKERIPWRLIRGTDGEVQIVPGLPVREGFFGGRNPGPPSPDTFKTLVK